MDKRIIKTRNAVRQAYYELLKEPGDRRITISSIARKGNINRKTFYLHYETPEDVVKEYGMEKVGQFTDAMKEKISASESGFSVPLFFDVLTDMIFADDMLVTFLMSLKNDSFFFDEIQAALVKAVVQDYSDQFSGMTEEELMVYANFYLSGILSVYSMWGSGDLSLSKEELVPMLRDASLNGLGPLVGKD